MKYKKKVAQFKPAETGYFDVVLGNPPYGFRSVLSKEDKDFFRKIKQIEFRSGDSAELFVKITFDNLVKEKGILTFIIPKKSLYGDAWEDTRLNYWKKYNLIFILDTGKSFENVLLEASVFGLYKCKDVKKNVTVSFYSKNGINTIGEFSIEKLFAVSNTLQVYKAQYRNNHRKD
ncbi:MAG: Eco57I restriction-modification methylase domain-containing protein [Paludibacteraceae bacterium]